MSWKECDRVSLRGEFCRLAAVEGANVSLLCKRFSISRQVGYKWLDRYRRDGDTGLVDRSRQPRQSPGRTSTEVEQAVLGVRGQHPAWGGRKIRAWLQAQGGTGVPVASTITAILRRHGQLTREEAAPRSWQRFERAAPNELWQMDFKGHFALTGGSRCHPLTVLDDHSRYSLALVACGNEQQTTVEAHLRQTFRRYGLPRAMLMDNGPPWGGATLGEFTALGVWLMDLDVAVLHGRPRHPQTQGKDERFHRTFKREVLQGRSFDSLKDAQRSFDPWREVYNHERPHDALNLAVPASRYTVSPRTYPSSLPKFEYDMSLTVRRVDGEGRVAWQGREYFLSHAFQGRYVGLRATEIDGQWAVYYRTFRVGLLDLTKESPRRGARGGSAAAR